MKFEQQNLNKQEARAVPQKLSEMVPFLKPTKEEIEYNEQKKKASHLFSIGKINDGAELTAFLRENRPREREFTKEQQKTFIESRGTIAKELGYEILKNEGKWFSLKKGEYKIFMTHFMTPSIIGYMNGRISEISVFSEKNNSNKTEFIGGISNQVMGKEKTEEKIIFDEMVNYFN